MIDSEPLVFRISGMPIWVKPLRWRGVGKPFKLTRFTPAAASIAGTELIAASSVPMSSRRLSSTVSAMIRSLEKGDSERSASGASMPVGSMVSSNTSPATRRAPSWIG